MRLTKPKFQILAASFIENLHHSYDKSELLIEEAGRVCYKSEDKITENSHIIFLKSLEARNHLSVFEHSWSYRFYPRTLIDYYPYLYFLEVNNGVLVAGNQRAFKEWSYKAKDTYVQLENNEIQKIIYENKRWDLLAATVKIVADRGVSHELVRHRLASYSQESTRYNNYSKDKFGKHLTFIIPSWCRIPSGEYQIDYSDGDRPKLINSEVSFLDYTIAEITWFWNCVRCEKDYLELIALGWTPQQARVVLNHSLKTEIVITANLQEWKHIFDLRALGTTGNPHPQMIEIMLPLHERFQLMFPDVFSTS